MRGLFSYHEYELTGGPQIVTALGSWANQYQQHLGAAQWAAEFNYSTAVL